MRVLRYVFLTRHACNHNQKEEACTEARFSKATANCRRPCRAGAEAKEIEKATGSTNAPFMIPKRFRGIGRGDIAILARVGERQRIFGGDVRWCVRERGEPRFAVAVPSRVVRRAVERSRIRRVVQASFSRLLEGIVVPIDLLVVWQSQTPPKVRKLSEELERILGAHMLLRVRHQANPPHKS